MSLSNKRFAEVFASLLPTGAGSMLGGDERRRAPRIDLNVKTHLLLVGDRKGRPVEIELRDVSVRGMKFTYRQALPQDQQFLLAVPQLKGEPRLILCTVVHSRRLKDGAYTIGAEFTLPLRHGKPATTRRRVTPAAR